MENGYDVSIETYLENVRLNCVLLQGVHKKRYFQLKAMLKYFKIPCIILSSCNSVVSVGMTGYLPQSYISGITCIISLIATIITSIEMYLKIENGMVDEEQNSRAYYLLGTNIFKTLSLTRENRKINAHDYCNEIYSEYNKLIERSAFVKKNIEDKLTPLPVGLMSASNSTISLEIN
jgi:hypothetical protein